MNQPARSLARLGLLLALAATAPLIAGPKSDAAPPQTAAVTTTPAAAQARPAAVAAAQAERAMVARAVAKPATSATPAQATPAVIDQRTALSRAARGLSPDVLAKALDAASCARAQGVEAREDLLTVIDYSLPSTEPRLWVLDLERGEVLFQELVAHGAGTGDNYARRFSNTMDSRQTSLGLFVTGGTYQGGNGYSMKLRGLEPGINDRAEVRHIVMHGAWYVNAEHARQNGRIGRSWGCPALSDAVAASVIDTIKGGSFVFSYYPEDTWLASSSFTNGCPAGGATPQTVRTAR